MMLLCLLGLFLTPVVSSLNSTDSPCYNAAENRYYGENDVSKLVFTPDTANYWARPVRDPMKPIYVEFQLTVRGVNEIVEKTSLVRIDSFVSIQWTDEFHSWQEHPHLSCVRDLVFQPEELGVWIPDLAFQNADKKFAMTRSTEDLLRLSRNGLSRFSPGGLVEFRCKFDLSWFPFDIQRCPLEFGMWKTPVEYAILHNIAIHLLHEYENQQWRVLDSYYHAFNQTYKSYNKSYSEVDFFLVIERKSSYYTLAVILPCILVAAVEISTFTLAFDKAIRLEVSFTCLLAFSVLQSMAISDLPQNADSLPLLLIFISLTTVYIAFAIYGQALSIYFAGKSDERLLMSGQSPGAPSWLVAIANTLGKIVCIHRFHMDIVKPDLLQSNDGNEISEVGDISTSPPRPNKENSWSFVARVIDRYVLIIFITLISATSLVSFAIVPIITSHN